MEKLQITKGEWTFEESDYSNGLKSQRTIDIGCKSVEEFSTIWTGNDRASDEDLLIAKIICDAGNTYQQCEELPSELLRQNREMKEALENTLDELYRLGEHCADQKFIDFEDESIDGVNSYNRIMKQGRECLTSCNKGKE